jgi:hypothetical protein
MGRDHVPPGIHMTYMPHSLYLSHQYGAIPNSILPLTSPLLAYSKLSIFTQSVHLLPMLLHPVTK